MSGDRAVTGSDRRKQTLRGMEFSKVSYSVDKNKYKEQNFQNYSKLFFLRVLFIGSEYYSRHGRTIRAREI